MAGSAELVRVAVVGAGVMGGHHLRVYDQLKGVELVAVVDPNRESAETAAAQYGINAYCEVSDLAGKVDAVTVASPSITHGEIGKFILENGIHCLMEKPLAVTEQECLSLIETAKNKEVTLMVGHIERFNPAVQQLAAILNDGHSVHAIDARRLSAVSGRISDVDVVLDLMIHDLDIVMSLIGKPVVEVEARSVSTAGKDKGGYVSAMLSFDNGALATLAASRITQNRVRELSVTTDLGLITIDYAKQSLVIYRQGDTAEKRLPGDLGNYRLDILTEQAWIRNAEPLVIEVQHFIDCVRDSSRPLVNGEDALEALKIVWQIQNSYNALT